MTDKRTRCKVKRNSRCLRRFFAWKQYPAKVFQRAARIYLAYEVPLRCRLLLCMALRKLHGVEVLDWFGTFLQQAVPDVEDACSKNILSAWLRLLPQCFFPQVLQRLISFTAIFQQHPSPTSVCSTGQSPGYNLLA